jgi:serine/threonine protein phosphatase PrpC
VASAAAIQDTLQAASDPEQAVQGLIDLANAAGGPDNIACVVADVAASRAQARRVAQLSATDQDSSGGRSGRPASSE